MDILRSGIKRKIVRIRSLDLDTQGSMLSPEDMRIDLVIHPEELTAQEIVRLQDLAPTLLGLALVDPRLIHVLENPPSSNLGRLQRAQRTWPPEEAREVSDLHPETVARLTRALGYLE